MAEIVGSPSGVLGALFFLWTVAHRSRPGAAATAAHVVSPCMWDLVSRRLQLHFRGMLASQHLFVIGYIILPHAARRAMAASSISLRDFFPYPIPIRRHPQQPTSVRRCYHNAA